MIEIDHIELLRQMIATPSISRQEEKVATLLCDFLAQKGVVYERVHNNIYALSASYNHSKPTLMLNSHIDTVRPAAGYTINPYEPMVRDGRLYGLGSNDAGASVVALTSVFLSLYNDELPYNLLLAISAEEEVGGEHGIRALLPYLKEKGIAIDCAVVGEPTNMQPAIAERGLVVLDCETHGVGGHAARTEGVNAIYLAMEDILALRNYRFERESDTLGKIGVTITQIEAGHQHNAIPDLCRWVVDVRTTDAYTNEQTVEILQSVVRHSTLTPRSTRVRASVIDIEHPLVQVAVDMGLQPFVSPTSSDMSHMHDFPSLKIGPGQSSRSHSADEYVELSEIDEAINIYHKLLKSVRL